jgi:hypothetical protein
MTSIAVLFKEALNFSQKHSGDKFHSEKNAKLIDCCHGVLLGRYCNLNINWPEH